ncbi:MULTISPECIES: ribosome silencing factor [unclassified Pseudofrankia]|uniref:ribosome silencing factor n=1 Tax=unclassified Pseudofrankia TaxID=2994372 RepID=UPI0008DA566B|nr:MULTISPECIES: ribosome silencing factor [unclassified Pseudofrankia]MDT3445404.1 ribosome silencing factor [Pseudofrankia sp. BMG5.37]OHV61261.1 ribosome silencing factor [Pseudofrankia sp. BMG5.36]
MTASTRAVELALTAAQAAADKLAKDLVILDVSDRLALTDCFVLASADNERQVKAVLDEVEEKLRLVGVKPLRREGEREGRWVLLDFSEIVVHIQRAEEREFYDLERLWKDCPRVDFEDKDKARATVGAGAGASAVPAASDANRPAGSW